MFGSEIESLKRRFWLKVSIPTDRDACWIWTGSVAMGYGQIGTGSRKNGDKRPQRAHRVSWALAHGMEPPNQLFVLHQCDQRLCVNPQHLRLGTVQDNQQDMANKGRSARGVKHRAAKLTEQDVRSIRAQYTAASGPGKRDSNLRQLAEQYAISPWHARNIVNYKVWRWLT